MNGINNYNSPYNPTYNPMARQNYEQNLKNIIEQASGQLQQLQQMQVPQPVPTNLTQNFQIAPQSNPGELQSAYVNNVDEVRNIFMTKNGVFVNKELNTLWFKNTEGKIRTFSMIEIIEKDEKDIEIEDLRKQIDEMRTLLLQKNNTSRNVQEEVQTNNNDRRNDKKVDRR